jgi:hypothetical protein
MDKSISALRNYFISDFEGAEEEFLCSDGNEDFAQWDDAVLARNIGGITAGTKVASIAFFFFKLEAVCYDADGDIVAEERFDLTPVK